MNELVVTSNLFPPKPAATRAADGLARRKWSAQDVQRMIKAGIITENERFELWGGELVEMAPRGRQHELLKIALNFAWARRCPPDLMIAPETAFHIDDFHEPEPDFIVYPASLRAPDVRADTVLLVVEIADSSLGHDLNVKARTYAAAGVCEYWVINAVRHVTTIHRDPMVSGYGTRLDDVPATQMLVPVLAPALAVRLADLDIGK